MVGAPPLEQIYIHKIDLDLGVKLWSMYRGRWFLLELGPHRMRTLWTQKNEDWQTALESRVVLKSRARVEAEAAEAEGSRKRRRHR